MISDFIPGHDQRGIREWIAYDSALTELLDWMEVVGAALLLAGRISPVTAPMLRWPE